MQSPKQLVEAYRATFYDARLPNGIRAALRIGRPVPEVLSAWAGRSWPLVFISACNPHSKVLPVTENRNRMRAMMARLDQPGIRKLLGVGRVPDQPWRESDAERFPAHAGPEAALPRSVRANIRDGIVAGLSVWHFDCRRCIATGSNDELGQAGR